MKSEGLLKRLMRMEEFRGERLKRYEEKLSGF
jgi:hypothetical protein